VRNTYSNRCTPYIECVMSDLNPALSFTLFDSAVGCCASCGTSAALPACGFSKVTSVATRDRIARRFPTACEATPPKEILRAIDGVVALLGGEPTDLSGVEIDTTGHAGF